MPTAADEVERAWNHHDALKFYVPQHLYFIPSQAWAKFFIYIHKPDTQQQTWLQNFSLLFSSPKNSPDIAECSKGSFDNSSNCRHLSGPRGKVKFINF